jgi:hypothetical protein
MAAIILVVAQAIVPSASAQTAAGLDTNPQLFAVMCALHAAGFEAEVSITEIHPVRAQLRAELLQLQGPATEALRAFYREHLLPDSAANLSRYVSYALVLGPPPGFQIQMRREDLPPDVLALESFNEVLAAFYQEAQLEKLWERVQPIYQQELTRLRDPVGQVVLVTTSYLRAVDRPLPGRTFTIYIEPMVGGKVNFRSIHDHYSVVISPTAGNPADDIRHAYLHFLLDLLAVRYQRAVSSRQVLHQFAGRAASLAPEYRDDFLTFLSECLVRAVELRLRSLPPARLAEAIDQNERDGFILVRALHEGLKKFEQAEPAMTFYYPELMNGIDVAQEAQRLQKVKFATAADAPAVPVHRAEGSELETWLREGEVRIASQDAEGAAGWFERVLGKYPGEPRAVYGLAVARILQKQGEQAKALFLQLVAAPAERAGTGAPAPDALILAWSHVYLGRIYDIEGNRDLARSEYRAALAVEGAPAAARLAAQRGLEKGFEPTQPAREPGQQRP